MRTTYTVLRIARVLVEEPREHYGYELVRRTGVRSGVAYPILQRMENEGWLKPRMEKRPLVGTNHERPLRRYYRVTALGQRELTAMVERAKDDLRFK